MALEMAVIGAGLTGLTAALDLARKGHQVTVYEESKSYGGLAASFTVGNEELEKFYHHIFTSDHHILDLIGELGLNECLEWFEPKNAIYLNNTLYPFTSPIDLIRFKPLSFLSRIRTGLLTLTSRFIKDYTPFDRITAREWLIQRSGHDSYDKVWGPLLDSKFDKDSDLVAGTWIWNKFKLRGSSRGKNIAKEQLGYIKGSFSAVAQKLIEAIVEAGGSVMMGQKVTGIQKSGDRLAVITNGSDREFDKVLFTASPQILGAMDTPLTPKDRYHLQSLRSKANLCLALELNQSLSPFYWITVAQKDIPFVLAIEHTRLVGQRGYGSHIVYLSRYIDSTDLLYQMSDAQITGIFLDGLKKLFPDFKESWVNRSSLTRALYAQPLVVKDYSSLIPAIKTNVTGLYLASMTQIYPEDRGLNYAVRLGHQASGAILEDL